MSLSRGLDRTAFYSAQEADHPEADGVAQDQGPTTAGWYRQKRVTTNQLAEQLVAITQLLPTLSSQVQALSEKRQVLEERVAGQAKAQQQVPAHRQPFMLGVLGPSSESCCGPCCPGSASPVASPYSGRSGKARGRPGTYPFGVGGSSGGPLPTCDTPDPGLRGLRRLRCRPVILQAQSEKKLPAHGQLHAGCGPKRLQEDVPHGGPSSLAGGVRPRAPPLHFCPVPGKAWRLPASQGPRPHHVHGESGGRYPDFGVSRGGPGPPIVAHGVPGASKFGQREVRGGLYVEPFCPTKSGVYQPGPCPKPPAASIRSFVPAHLGDHSSGLCEGDRHRTGP